MAFRTILAVHFPFWFILFHVILHSAVTNNAKEKSGANSKSISYIKKETGFFTGRYVVGHYLEYPELNGFFSPKSAVTICEGDFDCTGFTYQGAKNVGQSFYIYFFRYVAPPSISLSSVTNEEKVWTSYRVKRSFVTLPMKKGIKESIPSENDNDKVSSLSADVLSVMAINNDEKRIALGNKIKWSVPNYKAITLDPFSKQYKDNTKSSHTFAISERYANEDKFRLLNLDISRNQSHFLTILRLNPPIENINDKDDRIISVKFNIIFRLDYGIVSLFISLHLNTLNFLC